MTSAGDTPHTEKWCAVSTAGLTDSTQKQKIKYSGLSPGQHLSLFQSLQVRLTFSSTSSLPRAILRPSSERCCHKVLQHSPPFDLAPYDRWLLSRQIFMWSKRVLDDFKLFRINHGKAIGDSKMLASFLDEFFIMFIGNLNIRIIVQVIIKLSF